MEDSLPSTENEHQVLVITLYNVYKETISPQSSISDFSQKNTLSIEVMSFFHASNASQFFVETQKASSSDLSTLTIDSKTLQKNKVFEPDSS